MILDLDIGNSSIKWRRLQSPDQVAIGQGRAEGLSDLKRTVAEGGAIQRVRISCVRDSTFQESLQEWVQLNCQVDAEIAEVVREKAGLTVNYEDVSKLGVDRWLAMLAAFTSNDCTACTVIDCGTALTVDSIADNGQHLGGFIVPGLELSRKALFEFTGIKMAAPEKSSRLYPGNSTEEAVCNGVQVMLVAFLERSIEQAKELSRAAKNYTVYLTGGDAETLNKYISLPETRISIASNLVLEGLTIALP